MPRGLIYIRYVYKQSANLIHFHNSIKLEYVTPGALKKQIEQVRPGELTSGIIFYFCFLLFVTFYFSSRLFSWLWSTARYGPVSRSRELLGRSGQWTYGGPFLSSCRGVPGPLQRSPRPDRKQTVSQHHHGLSAFAGDFAKETAVLQDWFPFGDSSRWNSAGDQTRPQPIRNPGVHQHSRWVGQHQRSG